MSRPGFVFCACPDGQLLRQRLDELLHSYAPEKGEYERQVFWGDEELGPRFWEALTLQGLFDTPRALVLRNAQNLPAETWKRLSKALGRPNPQVWPLICLEVGWEKGQPKIPAHLTKLACFTFADKQGWVERVPGLTERTMRAHIQSCARNLGLKLSDEALKALCVTLPPDAAVVDNEMSKLSLFCGERCVEVDDTAICGCLPEGNLFGLISQLEQGRTTLAWGTALKDGGKNDDMIFPLISLLCREARLLWQILFREQVWVRPQELETKKRLATRLGMRGLARLWDLAHEAELGIKTGQRSPAQALDTLLGELTLLFDPDAGNRRPPF